MQHYECEGAVAKPRSSASSSLPPATPSWPQSFRSSAREATKLPQRRLFAWPRSTCRRNCGVKKNVSALERKRHLGKCNRSARLAQAQAAGARHEPAFARGRGRAPAHRAGGDLRRVRLWQALGGKTRRGSEKKVPFIDKVHDHRGRLIAHTRASRRARTRRKQCSRSRRARWCCHLDAGFRSGSDASAVGASIRGAVHERTITGKRQGQRVRSSSSGQVNTVLGNLKTALSGSTYHAHRVRQVRAA